MNIEKTECDRLGYEYKSLLEQVVYALHHIPYANEFISEERLKKLNDLCLKLLTGDCEIIEFKRTLCKYDFTDILKEKDEEIDRLNNIINELEKCIKDEYDYCDKRLEPAFGVGMGVSRRILNKLKELKENNKDE